MTINEWVKKVHDNAIKKGWHDKPRDPLTVHMLIVSEVAEATECVRNSEPEFSLSVISEGEPNKTGTTIKKPEGEAVELVDAVIRVFDYFGAKGWDFEEVLKSKVAYNETRSYRHGGKTA